MTNTRITDPEILERRYPLFLKEFSIRQHSGGKGRFHGRNGLIREIEALAPLQVSILSERRVLAPKGLCGGGDGQKGKNTVLRDAKRKDIGGKKSISLAPGDSIRIETPGGAGYGAISRD